MTLYRNLGAITFLTQTQYFEIFSADNSTLILQFKKYQEIDLQQINTLLTIYELILKQQNLLEIYSQKNKSSSILVHKAKRVIIDKINIQLLCRIIKELITCIIHSKKVVIGKIGQINKQMFFEINGQLRYIYIPTERCQNGEERLVQSALQFLNQIKDEKQVSHRILLKKISKCRTIEQILQQTEYFMSIYHAKQNNLSNINLITSNHQQFQLKTSNKSKFLTKNDHNQPQIRNSFALTNADSNNIKNSKRKYNLFKTSQSFNFRNTINNQSNPNFHSNTWRKQSRDNIYQNNTFRVNSRALHLDINSKCKQPTNSFFNRASSVNQSPKKLSQSKRRGVGLSFHKNHQKQASNLNQSMIKFQNKEYYKKNDTNRGCQAYQKQQLDKLNESVVSQKMNEDLYNRISMNNSHLQEKSESSRWMKQMVQKSLQKWKSKGNQKQNILEKVRQKDKQGSTQVDSRSKFLEKHDRTTNDSLKQSNISVIQGNQNIFSNVQNNKSIISQNQNSYGLSSEKKLKRTILGNRSLVVDMPKVQYNQQFYRKENDIEKIKYVDKQVFNKKQQLNVESLQEINLCQSSIEHLALKNKEEEMKQVRNMQRKKTSIKEMALEENKFEKNFSDQSQTQRIQYSRCSQKNLKTLKNQNYPNDSFLKQYKLLQNQLKSLYQQKQLIDYIGVAVVKTTQHLKHFQSIFWQLPMFFLYKKFYQKRINLSRQIIQFLTSISSLQTINNKIDLLMQLQNQSNCFLSQIQSQNINIEDSLKKLLKTVKKKLKKEYAVKSEQQYIERQLHLDYSIAYDNLVDQFISLYLNSLLEAKSQFPELVNHIIDIFEAMLVYKGIKIQPQKRQKGDQKLNKFQKAHNYFNQLIKHKQIKSLIFVEKQSKK